MKSLSSVFLPPAVIMCGLARLYIKINRDSVEGH